MGEVYAVSQGRLMKLVETAGCYRHYTHTYCQFLEEMES